LWAHGLLGEERCRAGGGTAGVTAGGGTRSLDATRSEVAAEVEDEVDAAPRDPVSNPARTIAVTAMTTTVAPKVRRLRTRALTTPEGRNAPAIGCIGVNAVRTTVGRDPTPESGQVVELLL
jgi:hypothetical protein